MNKILGTVVVGFVVLAGIIAFSHYQKSTEEIPFRDIFKETDQKPTATEYEIVPSLGKKVPAVPVVTQKIVETVSPVSIKPVETVVVPPVNSVVKNYFTIQILSSKDLVQAQKLLMSVQSKEPSAFLLTKDLGDKGVWHRIYVGKFETKALAQEQLDKLKSSYPGAFISSIKE